LKANASLRGISAEDLGWSQTRFAERFGLDKRLLGNGNVRRRQPDRTTTTLLHLIESSP
jgi:hypothetical protein